MSLSYVKWISEHIERKLKSIDKRKLASDRLDKFVLRLLRENQF